MGNTNQRGGVGEEGSEKSKLSKEDIVIFIAPLTAMSYALTYLYKISYLIYYRVPSMWIDLSIARITSTLLKISPIIFMGVTFSLLIFKSARTFSKQSNEVENKRKNSRRKILLIISSIFMLIGITGTYYMVKKYSAYLLLSSITGGLIPIVALFVYKFFRERRYYLSMVILWISLCAVTAAYGHGSAGIKDRYYTFIKDKEEYIVIDSYNEYLIVAPYRNNHFDSEVSLVEMKEVNSIRYKKTGRLERRD